MVSATSPTEQERRSKLQVFPRHLALTRLRPSRGSKPPQPGQAGHDASALSLRNSGSGGDEPGEPVDLFSIPQPYPNTRSDRGVISVDHFGQWCNYFFEVARDLPIVLQPTIFDPFIAEKLLDKLFGSLEGVIPARYFALLKRSPLAFLVALLDESEITVDMIADWVLAFFPRSFKSEREKFRFCLLLQRVLAFVEGVVFSLRLPPSKGTRTVRLVRSRPKRKPAA